MDHIKARRLPIYIARGIPPITRGFAPRTLSLALMALTMALSPVAGVSAQSQSSGTELVDLPGHVLGALSKATPKAATAGADQQSLTLTIVLNYSDRTGLDAFLRQLTSEPAQERSFLSPTEIAARYGPTQQEYDAVLTYLESFGFTLTEGSANRLTITVAGTRAQAEQAFNVSIGDYQLGDRDFFANTTNPRVPASIASTIQAVSGLSDLSTPRPKSSKGTGRTRAASTPVSVAAQSICVPTPPLPDCTPMALATAYDFQGVSGATGAGQRIGLFEFDTFRPSDVSQWLSVVGLPQTRLSQLSQVQVNGGVTSSTTDGQAEVLLDIDTVMGMAPAASYIVYSANASANQLGGISLTSYQTLLNRMVNDNVDVISIGWGDCEDQHPRADVDSIDAILAAGEAAGISVFDASGDTGATCFDGDPNDPGVPDDAVNQTTVGGTTLQVAASGAYSNESWWQTSPSEAGSYGLSGAFASGPGISRPSYQAGFTVSATRSVPDVSAAANSDIDGILICESGCNQFVGGTSLAAPIWASGAALLNQTIGHRTGNLDGVLYQVGHTSGFHPPSSMVGVGNDFAHVGLGSFDLGALYAAIVGNLQSAIIGGHNLTITAASNGVQLNWQGGTAQAGYNVLRQAGPLIVLATLPGSATSYLDPSPVPSTTNCYAIEPTGTSPQAVSDALCIITNFHSPSSSPTGFTLALNQTATANLSWGAPSSGAPPQYLAVAFNIAGQTLPASQTSIAAPTNGYTCFAVGSLDVHGALAGWTDALCGLPGFDQNLGAEASAAGGPSQGSTGVTSPTPGGGPPTR